MGAVMAIHSRSAGCWSSRAHAEHPGTPEHLSPGARPAPRHGYSSEGALTWLRAKHRSPRAREEGSGFKPVWGLHIFPRMASGQELQLGGPLRFVAADLEKKGYGGHAHPDFNAVPQCLQQLDCSAVNLRSLPPVVTEVAAVFPDSVERALWPPLPPSRRQNPHRDPLLGGTKTFSLEVNG